MLNHVRNLLVIVLLASLIAAVVLLAAAAQDARVALKQIGAAATETSNAAREAQKTITAANQILGDSRRPVAKILLHFDKAVGELANASQQAYKASLRSVEVTAKTETLVDNSNVLITQTTTAVKSLDETAQAFRSTARDLDALVTSPDVQGTVKNVRETSEHVDAMTGELAKTSEHVEHYVAQATKPASAVKSFVWKVLSPVATFLGAHF